MERSQGFITSVFRALTGSRCMIPGVSQVTGILSMLVTIGSHTPSNPISMLQQARTLAGGHDPGLS